MKDILDDLSWIIKDLRSDKEDDSESIQIREYAEYIEGELSNIYRKYRKEYRESNPSEFGMY